MLTLDPCVHRAAFSLAVATVMMAVTIGRD